MPLSPAEAVLLETMADLRREGAKEQVATAYSRLMIHENLRRFGASRVFMAVFEFLGILLGVWMLWLFFAAFAAQGAASILSDRTGSLAANVQYRAFAVFAALAAPMVALALSRWPPGPRLVRLAVAGVAAVVVAGASVGALVKSTLDPTVSNKWIFYTAPELEGIVWVTSRWPGMRLWVGPDDRLIAAYEMVVGGLSHADVWDLQDPEPDTQFFMVSEAIREQSQRVDEPIPALASTNLVYDNGEVQVDRVRASPPPS